jgi:hypothetical protein
VWHASVAGMPGLALSEHTLAGQARRALEGVGDPSLGEWEEWTGFAFHLRRRLNLHEEAAVGPVIDVRGTVEGRRRLGAVERYIPADHLHWAREELEMPDRGSMA